MHTKRAPRRIHLWLHAALIMMISLGAAFAQAAPTGLDERPSNLTCNAPPRPVINTSAATEVAWPNLSFITVPTVDDLDHRNGPIDLMQIPGVDTHWYVAEHAGKIHRVLDDDSATSFTTVLDMTSRFDGIDYFQQWGINAFTFHPDFANNGWMYVVYNDSDAPNSWISYVSRFTSTDGGLTFDPASEQIVISFVQPGRFHLFGDISFGADGMLYISSGSSGSTTGQDTNTLGGKLLRINVDSLPYTSPPDNPYFNGGGLPEIFAIGLRNPWRFSIDQVTGDIWLGDVGQVTWEEINVIENGGNYGWEVLEGPDCFAAGCDPLGYDEAFFQYTHDVGVAVTGGVVYRGTQIPELQGLYLFSDYQSSAPIWALNYDAMGQPVMEVVAPFPGTTSGFAEGNDGEVLIYSVSLQNVPQFAQIRRLVPGSAPQESGQEFPQTLTDTGCFDVANPTQPAAGLIPYNINSELWSDDASKRRWIALPDGATIDLDTDGDFLFPIGTVLVKEFSFDSTPIETRLLVRHDDGLWGGYSYEWEDDLSNALLLPAGKTKMINVDTTWTYPSRPQCMQCHTGAANVSLGPEISQLNGSLTYPASGVTANQLQTLEHIGLFTNGLPDVPANLPALAAKDDGAKALATRARSYLHSNCSGCHRPGTGIPAIMDLRSQIPITSTLICSGTPFHGDLGVPGAQLLFPGDPDSSVIPLRMKSLNSNRMPPLGTAVIDTVGTQLIEDWISEPDVCSLFADTDIDGVLDNEDNCTDVSNADQRDSDGDGFGNDCDADLNNDCVINFLDISAFGNVFLGESETADFNGDGSVNFLDLSYLSSVFLAGPGPSGVTSSCSAALSAGAR